MATNERKILTTLALDGEAEFKRGLDDAYRSMKVLGAELRSTSAEFGTNANSMEGLTKRSQILKTEIGQQKEIVASLAARVKNASEAYGEHDKRTDDYRIKLENAKVALINMERELQTTTKAMESGKYSTKALADRMEEMSKTLDAAGKKIQGFGEKASLISAAAVAAGAAVIKFTRDAGKTVDALNTLSAQTGISATTLQEWGYAAKFIDTEVSTMTDSMKKMIRNMDSAREGSGDVAESFKKLGVNVTNADGSLRSSETVFMESIDALGKVKNATDRDALAMKIFGKSAQDLNPLIKAGSATLRELSAEAHANGIILGEDGVAALQSFDDSMQRTNAQITAAKNNLAVAFAPAIESVSEEIAGAVRGFAEWVKTLDESQVKTIITIVGITAAVGPLIVGVGKVVSGIGSLVTILPALIASPVAPFLLAAAAAATLVAVASASIGPDVNAAAKAMNDSKQSITDFTDGMEGLRPSLSDVSALLSSSGKTTGQIDTAIEKVENKITKILTGALEDHRDLRAKEIASIEGYNEKLLALNLEKLGIYRDQQIAELTKISLAEGQVTQEQAQQFVVNASAAYAQADAVANEAYTDQLVIIENFFKARGETGSDAYVAEQENAKAFYDEQTAANKKYYDSAVSSVVSASLSWVSSDKSKYESLNTLTSQYYKDVVGTIASGGMSMVSGQVAADKNYSDTFAQLWSTINVDAANAFLAMMAIAQAGGVQVSEEAKTTASDILSAFEHLPPGMEEAGKSVLLGVIGGMVDKIPGLKSTSTMSAAEIVTAFKTYMEIESPSKVMKGIGKNVIQGLEDGMNSKKTTAADVAAAIGAAIVAAFKAIFGIKSPSRVMRDGVGKWLPLGIAQGIKDNAGAVTDALDNLLPSATSTSMVLDVTRRFNDVSSMTILPATVTRQTASESVSVDELVDRIAAAIAMQPAGEVTLDGRALGRFVRAVMA